MFNQTKKTSSGGGGSSTLAGLSDVSLGATVSGDVLSFNGIAWTNVSGEDLMAGPDYKTIVDEVSATVMYVGYAQPGSSTAAAVWKIQKFVFGSGDDMDKLHADGNKNFDKVWDDRLTYSYS